MQNRKIIVDPPLQTVVHLLAGNQLPTADLDNDASIQFFGSETAVGIDAVVGLQRLNSQTALLRSLAVAESARGQGIGLALLKHIEHYAAQDGVNSLYLLTETAGDYFARYGYQNLKREQAPVVIRNTSQFSSLCPDSALLFSKTLDTSPEN